jgi:acyl transferase domain-containing protein
MRSGQTIFVFSGQGSQYLQMGRALFDRNSTFRERMLALDAVAERLCGRSVIQVLYGVERGKQQVFDRTLLTHPAIFMVEYSLAQSLIHAGVMPDLTWGASVGSFAAAAVAGFVGAEEALAALVEQARALEERCERGGMVAILADSGLFQESFLAARSELAGVNFHSHFIVAAPERELATIKLELQRRGVPHQQLPVSFAFHSRWIDAAREPYESYLRGIGCKSAGMPMMCSESAAVLTQLPRGYFWDAARRPMRFGAATSRLEQSGSHRYIDVGPSGTLATFLKYGLAATSTSTVHTILSPYGRDERNFAAVTGMRH